MVLVVALQCQPRRARFPFSGMPWVFPIVFGVLILWSFVLGRTRFGRYVYAIGGSAEAARRAGIDLALHSHARVRAGRADRRPRRGDLRLAA